jgi:hypothetical protein
MLWPAALVIILMSYDVIGTQSFCTHMLAELDDVERNGDVVYVTGYDEEVLNGQAILNIFRKYDSRASRLS